jgi:hypothetical protein
VVVTANHYWLDALVAAALLAITLAINPRPKLLSPEHVIDVNAVPQQLVATGETAVPA